MGNTVFGVALLLYIALGLTTLTLAQRQFKESGRLTREGAGLVLATHAADGILRLLSAWVLQPDGIANLIHPWALVLVVLGATLFVVASRDFGSLPKVLCLDPANLTKDGLYRFSRNPQIVGYLLALLGFSVAWGDERGLLLLVVTTAFAHAWVMIEERHLDRVFGDEYAAYRAQVGRYF